MGILGLRPWARRAPARRADMPLLAYWATPATEVMHILGRLAKPIWCRGQGPPPPNRHGSHPAHRPSADRGSAPWAVWTFGPDPTATWAFWPSGLWASPNRSFGPRPFGHRPKCPTVDRPSGLPGPLAIGPSGPSGPSAQLAIRPSCPDGLSPLRPLGPWPIGHMAIGPSGPPGPSARLAILPCWAFGPSVLRTIVPREVGP